jgi:predicted HTH domain antitoxin
MHTFTIRDLRDRSGELSHEAESGNVSLITKHGQPLMLSVPFDKVVVESGVNVSLAVNLFKSGHLSTGMAARVARMSRLEFTELVSGLGIAVVDYPVSDLADEFAQFS